MWAAALVVALGAGVATAHGLYEVAVAAGVPVVIAALYPLITDGLALVAYAATARLRAGSRSYAWTVVVLAAGLSGVAQAGYLAGGVESVSTALRFGIGAWPAVAAATVAHLLHLLGRVPTGVDTSASTPAGQSATPSNVVRPTMPSNVEQHAVQPDDLRIQEQPGNGLVRPAGHNGQRPDAGADEGAGDAEGDSRGFPAPRERARTVARRHVQRHGRLPTVTELMSLANVSRGTAGTALQELRDEPTPLHLVDLDTDSINT